MNLELEQRRTDYEKRSRQLTDQSRCACIPQAHYNPKLLQHLADVSAACREIGELKELLESQTNLNDSLQQEMQQREVMVSQVGACPAALTLPLMLLRTNSKHHSHRCCVTLHICLLTYYVRIALEVSELSLDTTLQGQHYGHQHLQQAPCVKTRLHVQ